MTDERFTLVGPRQTEEPPTPRRRPRRLRCWPSAAVLAVIAAGCLGCGLLMTHDPSYMDLQHVSAAPCREFLFGTDTMGRDIFSMIWYGGGDRRARDGHLHGDRRRARRAERQRAGVAR